eukprot:1156963-Pelagomonas_calceolata.AAC.4
MNGLMTLFGRGQHTSKSKQVWAKVAEIEGEAHLGFLLLAGQGYLQVAGLLRKERAFVGDRGGCAPAPSGWPRTVRTVRMNKRAPVLYMLTHTVHVQGVSCSASRTGSLHFSKTVLSR